MSLFTKLFGDISSKFIKNTDDLVAQINALEESVSTLGDDDFPKKTLKFNKLKTEKPRR